eukprot:TRINITY_DN29729_c0_g1_i1.p1 TRINITY_DN29729_c0_g1~~TRINITY_DN29729_c0_g1_i1.p1  ORF type:complete len:461 (-),score=98.29 TRINITY_DN29729_c0_g1_i1:134-1459(-)
MGRSEYQPLRGTNTTAVCNDDVDAGEATSDAEECAAAAAARAEPMAWATPESRARAAERRNRRQVPRCLHSRCAWIIAMLLCATLLTLLVAAVMGVYMDDEEAQEEEMLAAAEKIRGGSFAAPRRNPLGGAAFHEAEAFRFMQLARASLCAAPAVEAWRCGSICESTRIEGKPLLLGAGGASGFVAPLDKTARRCVVVFRGAESLRNWALDSEVIPVRWPLAPTAVVDEGAAPTGDGIAAAMDDGHVAWCKGCYVHEGFAHAYSSLRESVHQAIDSLGCEELAVTGHSGGAALATLAALELRADLGLRTGPVYLFGAPRVGNKAFAEAFAQAAEAQGVAPPAWRVVHFRDPMPRVGPKTEPFDYWHFPQEVFYNERSSSFQVCNPNTGEDPLCADSISLASTLLPPTFDHLRYLNLSTRRKFLPAACTDAIAASARAGSAA